MAAAKPPKSPTFDAKGFSKRLYERVLSTSGDPYVVFDYEDDSDPPKPIGLPRWKQWVDKLRDTVNANAVYLDEVKSDVDNHTARLDNQAARLTALETSPARPFPGSG